MKWMLKLEFPPDGSETITHDIGTITRPIADLRPEEIGLTLGEGHEVVRDIERRMIGDQIHAYTLCFRRCPRCGQQQPFKDVRTKCVLTVFGAYRFLGRRIRLCRCQVDCGCTSSFFRLGQIIPRRTTPEVRHLFAQLGATMHVSASLVRWAAESQSLRRLRGDATVQYHAGIGKGGLPQSLTFEVIKVNDSS